MKTKIIIYLFISLISFGCNSQEKTKDNRRVKNKDISQPNDSLKKQQQSTKQKEVEIIQYKLNKEKDNLSVHNTLDKKLSFKKHIRIKKKKNEIVKFAIEVTNTEGYIIKKGKTVKGRKYSKSKLQNGYISQSKKKGISILNYDESKNINKESQNFLVETGLLLIENDRILSNELNKYKKPHLLSGIGITKQNQLVFLITKNEMKYLDFAKVMKKEYKCISATLLQVDNLSFYNKNTNEKNGIGNENAIFIVSKKNDDAKDDIEKEEDVVDKLKKTTIKPIGNQINRYTFLNKKYVVCKIEKSNQLILSNPLKIINNKDKFHTIHNQITNNNKKHVFSMNAGMYDNEQRPIGLYINNGEQKHELNIRKGGYGNFYGLPPNGVFIINDSGKSEVVTTDGFLKNYNPNKVNLATQSGPMMVINGKFNVAFNEGSPNLNIRNGIGVTNKGTVYMVISEEPVNFYEFSQLFRDVLKCDNALYLDGVVSQYFSPKVNEEIHNSLPIGPIISVMN